MPDSPHTIPNRGGLSPPGSPIPHPKPSPELAFPKSGPLLGKLLLSGLSTTEAHKRIVDAIEEELRPHFEASKRAKDWCSKLHFLTTMDGLIPLLCVGALVGAYVAQNDWQFLVEAAFILPYIYLNTHVSFRINVVQKIRAAMKVRVVVQRFSAALEDAEEQRLAKHPRDAILPLDLDAPCPGSPASVPAMSAEKQESIPPSCSFVEVLRNGRWRSIPSNLVVIGDIFKLSPGEQLPCYAKMINVRELVLYDDYFGPDMRFSPGLLEPPRSASFIATSHAFLPQVTAFLTSGDPSPQGANQTLFWAMADNTRHVLWQVWFSATALMIIAAALWCSFDETAPGHESVTYPWLLARWLVPVRITICFAPLVPLLMLHLTDLWGNARCQALFEWHADEDRRLDQPSQFLIRKNDSKKKKYLTKKSLKLARDVSVGSPSSRSDTSAGGEGANVFYPTDQMVASEVPWSRRTRELVDVLMEGLDGVSNVMHTLNSTSVVCFCDKEGLLTNPGRVVQELCVCVTEDDQASHIDAAS